MMQPLSEYLHTLIIGLEALRDQEAHEAEVQRKERNRQARIAAAQAAREKAWVVYKRGVIQTAILIRPNNARECAQFCDEWTTKGAKDAGFQIIRVYVDHPEGIPCACGQRIDGFQSA